MRSGLTIVCLTIVVMAVAVARGAAQQGVVPVAVPPPPSTPRSTAPVDLTGYWVSIVTEDWRWRMVTPAKGDTISIPVNQAAQKVADVWDYQKDIAAGLQCKAYGAGGLMRMPTRLHITWMDDNTLQVEADAGQQTKLLHFAHAAMPAARTWQGYSTAEWIDVLAGRGGGRAGARGGGGSNVPAYGLGGLKTVTTNVRAGYLRKNGVPYSDDVIVTEYFDRVPGPRETQWLIVKTIVEDPAYLVQPYITSAHFLQEPDGSKWHPTPCEVDPPLTPPKREGVR